MRIRIVLALIIINFFYLLVGDSTMKPPSEKSRRYEDAVDRDEHGKLLATVPPVPLTLLIILVPFHEPPSAAVSESQPPPHITTYAQLSSLPEFKAFKLNQSQERYPLDRYAPETLVQAENHDGQEFMKEIRVIKRTKKQNYVRSGTHDFCVRLYMAHGTK
jgi:hypothetical protein